MQGIIQLWFGHIVEARFIAAQRRQHGDLSPHCASAANQYGLICHCVPFLLHATPLLGGDFHFECDALATADAGGHQAPATAAAL